MKRIPITVRPRKNNNRNIRHKSALYAKTIKTQLIGLTGGIASGKTTVSRYLESRGFPIIDTDLIVKDLLSRKAILQKVQRIFKTTDKAEIRHVIFSSAEKKRQLEKLLHPKVWREVSRLAKKLKKTSTPRFIFVVVPLLFETGSEKKFDTTVVVHAPLSMQLRRLTKRDRVPRSLALKMIKSQWPSAKKAKLAQYVIKNNKDLASLRENTKEVIRKITDV